MGRCFVFLVVAGSVFLHTVAGCCAHHAHAAVNRAERDVAPSCSAHSVCRHAHGRCRSEQTAASEPRQSPEESHLPSHECDEADCAFAVSRPAVLPDLMLTVAGTVGELPAAGGRTIVAHSGAFPECGQRAVWRPDAVRAHLWLCDLRN